MPHTKIVKYILVIFLLAVAPKYIYGQASLLEKEITIPKTTGSTVEILKLIEQSIGIPFSYSNKLCLKDHIQLSANRNSIKGFIYEIFNDCSFQISEKKNKIIIVPDTSIPLVKKYNIHGFVNRLKDSESLIGASVYNSFNWQGVNTNNFGYYNLDLEEGEVVLNCSYVGFQSVQHRFELKKDTVINFLLKENTLISEIPVVSFITPEGINSTRNSTINVPVEQIRKVPSFLGEVDVARTLQLLPGINGGSEGVSGLYVRGGGADQNLFLIDDVPVYNISHLLGFFSVFNEDAINKVTITKGGFPARYGGRLSSVVDVRLKDGNNESIHGTASLGMMSSKLALNGPLYKDKTTFSVSFRRSYYDLVSYLIRRSSNSRTSFYFYDSNAKVSHKINDKNRLYLSFYGGKDRVYTKYNFNKVRNPNQPDDGNEQIDVNDENYSGWGNTVASLRWNKIYNDKIFSNISLAYSQYSYSVGFEEHLITNDEDWNYFEQKYYSGIKDYMAKTDFDYYLTPNHHVRFGGNYIFHTFNPGADLIRESYNSEVVVDSTIGGNDVYGNEFYFYLEDDFNLTHSIKLNAGIHTSLYGIKDKLYHSWQPRLSVRYLMFPKFALKGSFSKMTQYIHLLTSSSVSLPTDLWIPVTENIKPQHATQYSVGGKLEINKGFDLSVIGYYKYYDNLLAYGEESASNLYSNIIDNNLVAGKGQSKGIEMLIHKRTGKFTGWVGYTLAKSTQRFIEINEGHSFPTTNDRRHDIGIFGNYVLNNKIDFSATWLFGSGNTVTLPSQKYYSPALPTSGVGVNDGYSEYISTYNGYKMPVFHRLDVGVNLRKKNRLGERIWSMGIYNVYGHQNAFSLYFSNEEDGAGNINRELRQLSIFPFPLPYLRYTLRF
ncbi:TonB-dependent receptor [Plebeiibacterium sediminum]|uniref:TonB-dependent receptor n=1 Tax=Plebeiibacterium sediminum TaxID=2992112 RepID=A0AAE3M5J1_9BACT|nr:carboxypeptidase-like regulatory domain-containing protein [Plebeiobacterium sediminum]MCW3787239.1 TonB-dependent receptor [Plebeiobacterium sediminum]